jgi:RNA polymerase sigma-70 factor (ECF subfamily)
MPKSELHSTGGRWCIGEGEGAGVTSSDRQAARKRDDGEQVRRFQALALPHLDAAYNLARWLSGNSADAEDIVQEAFMRALRFFDSFEGDSARPWLLAIVRRTWYSEWRRRASTHEVVQLDEELDDTPIDGWGTAPEDPQTLMIREQDTRLVHEALAELPVEFREVLILRELEDLSYREIAAVTELPIGTVMSRIARARRKFAAIVTSREPQRGASHVRTTDGKQERPDGM